ncbi:hypothetical protein LTR53_012661 [Teratosphaeriaceae sp. CCFEE 6253]|nr:hypothetical protein LTR53_012661 [Teratosphaeriaceae sp. CCFEE 6253]
MANVQAETAFQKALQNNQRWAAEYTAAEPDFFPTTAKSQSPDFLWIGCTDSRVPETTILGLKPGNVCAHRNIANIVAATDLSILAVIEFAVVHLKVKHVVVCGHSACGGVAGSMGNGKLGAPLDIFIQPLRALREKHMKTLKGMSAAEQKAFITKTNVEEGVHVVKRIPTVIDAMRDRGLQVHGVLYDLTSGKLEEVDCDEGEEASAIRDELFERK